MMINKCYLNDKFKSMNFFRYVELSTKSIQFVLAWKKSNWSLLISAIPKSYICKTEKLIMHSKVPFRYQLSLIY